MAGGAVQALKGRGGNGVLPLSPMATPERPPPPKQAWDGQDSAAATIAPRRVRVAQGAAPLHSSAVQETTRATATSRRVLPSTYETEGGKAKARVQEGAEAVDTHGGERPGQLSAGDRVSQRESVITEVPTVEVLLQERDELMRQLESWDDKCHQLTEKVAAIVQQNQSDVDELTQAVRKATREHQDRAAAHETEMRALRSELALAKESESRAAELSEKLLSQAADLKHSSAGNETSGCDPTRLACLRDMLAARSEEVLVQSRIIATLRAGNADTAAAARTAQANQAQAELTALRQAHADELNQVRETHAAKIASLEAAYEALQADVQAVVADLKQQSADRKAARTETTPGDTSGLDRHIRRLVMLSARPVARASASTTEADADTGEGDGDNAGEVESGPEVEPTGSVKLMMAVRDSIAQLKSAPAADGPAIELPSSAFRLAVTDDLAGENAEPNEATPTAGAATTDRGGVSSAAPTDLTELLFAEIAQQEAYIRACTADHWGAIGEIEQAVAALVDVVQRDHSGVQLVRATHSHQARRKGELCARAGDVFRLEERLSVSDEEWWLVTRVDTEPGAVVGAGSSGLIPAHKLKLEDEGDAVLRQCVQVRHCLGEYTRLLSTGPATRKFHLVKRCIARMLLKLGGDRGHEVTSTSWASYIESGWDDTHLDLEEVERGLDQALRLADTYHLCATSVLSHGHPIGADALPHLNQTLQHVAETVATTDGGEVGAGARLGQVATLTKDYVSVLSDHHALQQHAAELEAQAASVGAASAETPKLARWSSDSHGDHAMASPSDADRLSLRDHAERHAFEQGGLPPGWEAAVDPVSGSTYFVNHQTQSTTWLDPRTLYPAGPTQMTASDYVGGGSATSVAQWPTVPPRGTPREDNSTAWLGQSQRRTGTRSAFWG